MSRRAHFTVADIKRAISGTLSAGLNIAKIEIDPTGKIVIIPGLPDTRDSDSDAWDARIRAVREERAPTIGRKRKTPSN